MSSAPLQFLLSGSCPEFLPWLPSIVAYIACKLKPLLPQIGFGHCFFVAAKSKLGEQGSPPAGPGSVDRRLQPPEGRPALRATPHMPHFTSAHLQLFCASWPTGDL